MATSPIRTYSTTKLQPFQDPNKARQIPVRLASSGTYPRGTRLIETGTQGIYQAWSTAIVAAGATQTLNREIQPVAAGSDLSTVLGAMSVSGVITSITYFPLSAMTGDNTNYRTLSVVNKGAAGSGSTSVASLAMLTGVNASANVGKAITLSGTPANLAITAGDVLDFTSVHTASGIADPGGMLQIVITPNLVQPWQAMISMDAQTDSSGNITLSPTAGQILGDETGSFEQSVPAWISGIFLQSDLPSFGANDLLYAPPGTRVISGTVAGNTAAIYIP